MGSEEPLWTYAIGVKSFDVNARSAELALQVAAQAGADAFYRSAEMKPSSAEQVESLRRDSLWNGDRLEEAIALAARAGPDGISEGGAWRVVVARVALRESGRSMEAESDYAPLAIEWLGPDPWPRNLCHGSDDPGWWAKVEEARRERSSLSGAIDVDIKKRPSRRAPRV